MGPDERRELRARGSTMSRSQDNRSDSVGPDASGATRCHPDVGAARRVARPATTMGSPTDHDLLGCVPRLLDTSEGSNDRVPGAPTS